MNVNQFKNGYYIQRVYGNISQSEIFCRLIVKKRQDDTEITGLETKINVYDIGQQLADSRFAINTITWENYLNQTIVMLFNMLMLRLGISGIYTVYRQDVIEIFFDENPFHEE